MPVRVTLTCAWCGREAEECRAEMDRSGAKLCLRAASCGLKVTHGWPVCAHCGGPLLVEDWHPLDARSSHASTQQSTQPDRESQRLAA
jgi:hypothetical protein